MASSDGSVVIDILGKTDNFRGELNKLGGVAQKAMKGVSSGISTAMKAISVGVGAASTAVGVLAKQSLSAYGNYEQLVGGVEALFKDSADIVKEYADNAYKTSGLSANEYMETVTSFAASLLQGLGGDTEEAAKMADVAITDMSDNANKMGTDMASIQYAYQGFAKQNYTMLDNLKLGYGGTQAEMARLVNESDVLGDTVEVTAKTINEVSFDKIIEAIHVTQERMGITGTTAKEAATTIEGSVNAAKAAWTNLVTGLGDENANLDRLVQNFIESATIAANNVVPRITKIVSGLGKAIQKISPILSEEISSLVTKTLPDLIGAGAELVAGLISGIISALPALASATPKIISSIVQPLANNIVVIADVGKQLVKMLITGITTGLPGILSKAASVMTLFAYGIRKEFPKILEVGANIISSLTQALLNGLPGIIYAAFDIVNSFINTLTQGIKNGTAGIVSTAAQIVNAFAQAVYDNLPNILIASAEIVGNFALGILENLGKIIDAGKNLVFSLVDGITGAVPQLLLTAAKIVPRIASQIVSNIGQLISAGAQIVAKLVDGIISALPYIAMAVPQIISQFVKSLTEQAAGVASSGKALIEKLVAGIKNAVPKISAAVKYLIEGFLNFLEYDFPKLVSAGYEMLVEIGRGIRDALPEIAEAALDIISNLVQTLVENAPRLWDAADAIIGALADSIKEKFPILENSFIDLKTIIEGVTIAFAALRTAMVIDQIIYTVSGAISAMTLMCGGLSGAIAAVNAALYACPLVWAAAAFVLAAVGGWKLAEALDHLINKTDKASKSINTFSSDAKEAFSSLPEAGEKAGYGMAEGVAKGVKSGGNMTREAYDKLVMQTGEALRKAKEESQKAGDGAGRGFASGFTTSMGSVKEAYNKLARESEKQFSGLQKTARGAGRGTSEQLGDGISEKSNTANTACQNIVDTIRGKFDGLKETMRQSGAFSVDGLVQGIQSKWSSAVNTVKKLSGDLVKNVKSVLKIHSPSKVFDDEIGAQIPPGIGEGVKKKMPSLSSDIEKELQGLINEANLAVSAEVKGFAGRTSLASAVKSEPPQTITNDNGITIPVTVNYYGNADPTDVKKISRQIGVDAAREMRRRGVLA